MSSKKSKLLDSGLVRKDPVKRTRTSVDTAAEPVTKKQRGAKDAINKQIADAAEQKTAAKKKAVAAKRKAADQLRAAKKKKKAVADKKVADKLKASERKAAAEQKASAERKSAADKRRAIAAERTSAVPTISNDTPTFVVPRATTRSDEELRRMFPKPAVVPEGHISFTPVMRTWVVLPAVEPKQQEHSFVPMQQPAPDALTMQAKKKLIAELTKIARDACTEPTPMHDSEEDIIVDMVQDTSNDTLFAANCDFCCNFRPVLVKWDDLLMCKSCQL
jgi:hypothetical protein